MKVLRMRCTITTWDSWQFFPGLRSLSLYPWWSFIPEKPSHYWASLILAFTEPKVCSCLINRRMQFVVLVYLVFKLEELISLLSLILPSFMHLPSYSRSWSTLTCLQKCSPSTSTRITSNSMRILMTLYVCMCHFSLCDPAMWPSNDNQRTDPGHFVSQMLRKPVKWPSSLQNDLLSVKISWDFLGMDKCRMELTAWSLQYSVGLIYQ